MLPSSQPQLQQALPVAPVTRSAAGKPPRISANMYWEPRSTGYVLTYRKRDSKQPSGFRFLYLGLWPHEVLNRMAAQLNADDFVAALRYQANQNARLYLQRKAQRSERPATV